MKKPTILAALALVAVSFAACDQVAPTASVCSIVGQVSIEGTGIDGVTVTLSNGNSTTTTGGGKFRFRQRRGRGYTHDQLGSPRAQRSMPPRLQ